MLTLVTFLNLGTGTAGRQAGAGRSLGVAQEGWVIYEASSGKF